MPKTGTSAVQLALWSAREQLADHGVHNVSHHPHERDVGLTAIGSDRAFYRHRPWRWRQLAEEFRSSRSRQTVWSSEALSLASAERVERLRAELGPAYIVTTLRPLAPQLASRWQQGVRRGARLPLDDWLRHRLARPTTPDWDVPHVRGDTLQRSDPRRIVEHWGRVFGEDRLLFVIQEPDDRSLLLRRVEALLGVPAVMPEIETANASLPYPETEVIRHYAIAHHALGRSRRRWMATVGDPRRLRVRTVVQQATRRPIRVPRWAAERANEHATAWAEGLQDSAATVVGDVNNLLVDPADHPVEDEQPTVVDITSAGQLIQACVDASVPQGALDMLDLSGETDTTRPDASPALGVLEPIPDAALVRELGRRVLRRLRRRPGRQE
ncbi:hypothetical protein [Nocardioides sp. L-11A]|uniref:hypothetical protein n=1 Tax=Nocardioides sp. L-11A TaxID=3043848 RepID=UPI00249C4B38|nr:hypothetical protein QJ852_24075 [Nocardioides sp. L-11A]